MRTSNTGDGFLAGKIGNVDESIIEAGIEVRNAEHELALSNLGTERDGSLLLGRLSLLWCLQARSYVSVVLDHISPSNPRVVIQHSATQNG